MDFDLAVWVLNVDEFFDTRVIDEDGDRLLTDSQFTVFDLGFSFFLPLGIPGAVVFRVHLNRLTNHPEDFAEPGVSYSSRLFGYEDTSGNDIFADGIVVQNIRGCVTESMVSHSEFTNVPPLCG